VTSNQIELTRRLLKRIRKNWLARSTHGVDSLEHQRAIAAETPARDELKAAWAAENNVTEAPYPEWRRLLVDPFDVLDPDAARLVRSTGSEVELPWNLPADDHGALWERDGKPVRWVSQPYPKELSYALPEMIEAADEFGLTFEIRPSLAWHYPLGCLFGVWRRA
jgi:hypothetical protein